MTLSCFVRLPLVGWVTALWSELAGACLQDVILDRECRTRHGAVACVDHHAARIGAEVLAEGGNAVDAAIAVAFALAVTHPAAGNLGGGGFLLFARSDGEAFAVDYREVAPAAAHEGMFLDERGGIDEEKAGIGHHVVGVPGTVAGLELAHQRFGTMPWPRLVAPARALAETGIEVDEDLARGLREHAALFARQAACARCFLHPDGRSYAQGEVLRQRDLAHSLRWIEERGAEAFYRGPIAALIDAEMRSARALLTAADLAAYKAVLRIPVRFRYRDHEVLSMPPPSSGGIALAVILGILEPFALREHGPESPLVHHLLAEAQRRAFAQRAEHLADPVAMTHDSAELVSAEQLEVLRASIQENLASTSAQFGPPLQDGPGSEHTTHFSVIDAAGNAVANTYTLEESFGAKIVADGTGFLLNNELHDFNLKPGWTDRKGRIGTEPNLARPGQRPLSSMTPTIVRSEHGIELITGSPGGRTIINTVACIVLRVLEFEQSIADAVAARRQHHPWFPDELLLEAVDAEQDGTLFAALTAIGHRVKFVPRLGDAHSIAVSADGEQWAVADRRIDGWVATPASHPAIR